MLDDESRQEENRGAEKIAPSSDGSPTPLQSEPRALKRPDLLHQPPSIRGESAGNCSYCGAPLSAHLHFCLVCGQRYRETVVDRPLPPVTTNDQLMRTHAPSFWNVYWTIMIGIVAVSIVDWLASDGDERGGTFIVFGAIVMSGLALVTGLMHKDLVKPLLQKTGISNITSWVGILLLAPLLLMNYYWHSMWEAISPDLVQSGSDSWGLGTTGIIVFFCVVPAVSEEILFRGVLQTGMTRALGFTKSLVVVSALFAAAHFSVLSFIYLFIVGAYLGWIRERTNSLYPPILLHFLHNFLVMMYVH